MILQYIKQAWQMLKENKLLSSISILGTALAICMIMIIVILYQVNTANISPEVHRNRTYHISAIESIDKSTDQRISFAYTGLPFINDCLYPLTSAEAVTATSRNPEGKLMVQTMDGTTGKSADVLFTDGAFWKVFTFDFIDGQPFSDTDANSGIYTVVINENLARTLFNTTQVTGREIKINYIVYKIKGMVKDVSRYADKAYAEVWIPYFAGGNTYAWGDGINGNFDCHILLPQGTKRETLHQEITNRVATYNAQTPQYRAEIGDQPFSQIEYWMGGSGHNKVPDLFSTFLRYGIIIIVVLLVPALNLSGITLAQMRKRIGELGVRRAFGATAGNVLWQVLSENLLLTLLGGLVGLIFSYVGLVIFRNWLLVTSLGETSLTGGMFSPAVFVAALVFCVIMNLLSAGIPAWRVSRVNIVESIKEE